MIDKLGLDGLGGASVRVETPMGKLFGCCRGDEPTPQDSLKEVASSEHTSSPAHTSRPAVVGFDLNKCPNCGGPADNGHDRCYPPNPYFCTKCDDLNDNLNYSHLCHTNLTTLGPTPRKPLGDSKEWATPAVVGLEPAGEIGSVQGQTAYVFQLTDSAFVVGSKLYSATGVARLQAENEALKQRNLSLEVYAPIIDRVENLERENEALRKDAERYRWLLTSARITDSLWYLIDPCFTEDEHHISNAIDAAMKGE